MRYHRHQLDRPWWQRLCVDVRCLSLLCQLLFVIGEEYAKSNCSIVAIRGPDTMYSAELMLVFVPLNGPFYLLAK
jgi:hypothetical protein